MYKDGQRLICVVEGVWTNERGEPIPSHLYPKKGEEVTCAGESPEQPEHIYLVEYTAHTDGYRDCFYYLGFVPANNSMKDFTNIVDEVMETADIVPAYETIER